MGRSFGFISLIIVVAIGGYIYVGQMHTLTPNGSSPNTAVTITAIRNDLMAMANAERHYFASNGKYATLDELRSNNRITVPSRLDYTYSAEVSESQFKIVATYSGTDPNAPRRISVNDAMDIRTD